MAAPTVTVTIDLSTMLGVAAEGVVITASLNKTEVYDGFIIAGTATATTDENGVATIDLFPNAPADADPAGLGTTGSEYRFQATATGGKKLDVRALVPNQDCDLHSILLAEDEEAAQGQMAGSIRYDVAQSLTSPQQAQARSNMGFDAAVRAVALTGLSLAAATAIAATDTVLVAVGKAQAQITALDAAKANLTGAAFSGAVSAPGFTGPLTGNASTATALATARAINGVNFDGTAAITVTAAAGTLTGNTLAANVVNASLNAITPTGGTLAVNGVLSASGVAAGVGGNLAALSPDGLSQLVLGETDAGSMDLISYKGVGGGSFRFVSGDAGGNTVLGSWSVSGATVNGTTNAGYRIASSGNVDARNWAALANVEAYGDFAIKQSNALGGDPVGAGTTRVLITPGGVLEARAGITATGNVTASGHFSNDNYGLTLNNDGFGYWMGFTGVRAAGIYTDNGTIRIRSEFQDLFHLTGSALALTARQTIAVNSASAALTLTQNGGGFALDIPGSADQWYGRVGNATGSNFKFSGTAGAGYALMQSFITDGVTAGGVFRLQRDGGRVIIGGVADDGSSTLQLGGRQVISADTTGYALNVYNPNTGGYGVRIHSAGLGGESALSIENNTGSATVFMVKNNGGLTALFGDFSYGLGLDNNTGVISFKDTGGTQRRTILRASDQIIFGDVDNSTTDSYLSFCANLSQRHVIDNNQIGVWGATGLGVTGLIATTANSASAALSAVQNGAGAAISAAKPAGGAGLLLDATTGTADTGMDIRWLRGGVLKWQLGSGYATGGDNLDFYDRGGGDRLVWQAVPNGAFNIMVPTNVVEDLTVSGGGDFLVTSGSITAGTRFNLPPYTVATLPAAGAAAGLIFVSDESGGAVPAFSDGTNWRRVTDRAIVS